MKIVTVLRAGKTYWHIHVDRIRRQCAKFAPDVEFVCLADAPVRRGQPLLYDWPGWWAKMEMFRPDVAAEPFLYMDLDTTICGPIDDFLVRDELTVLSDFYRPHQIQSSLMLVTPEAAHVAWEAFNVDPEYHIQDCNRPDKWGDQGFLEMVWGRGTSRWQDRLLPGRVVSYKKHCLHGIPDAASIVCFHGKPRPWEI